jgi:uncharacterized protein (DUF1015 family)
MRYNPQVVGDIGAVTSPPYDVMDRPMIDTLLTGHARNIVRLILPRMVSDPVTDSDPYHRAAALLERWRSGGILVTDDLPSIYVYSYGDATHSVCGLVGALELRQPDDHVVLPHEDVIPGIVADRLAMMEASEANLEPILLVYDGAGATADIMDRARAGTPLIDVDAPDGTFHRLWAIDNPAELAEIDRQLAPHQALIADGHHRYATYLQLQDRRRDAGAGPWDRGLVLLIDQSQCPLSVGPIHRSVSELALDGLTAPPGFTISACTAVDVEPAAPPSSGELVVTDGRYERTVRWGANDRSRSRGLVSDAEVLHMRLLPAWSVSEERVGYHHTVRQTLRNAHQDDGVAVLMHPTTVAEVMDVARAGRIMPRKSTSFGPKPRMGLVMRTFADDSPRADRSDGPQ